MQAPYQTITNVEPVERLKWVPSSSVQPTTLIGVGSVLGDSTLSTWDIHDPFVPKNTFKTHSNNKITDFVFIPEMAIYTNKSSMLIAEGFNHAPCLIDERRAHPVCCDILENYCFSYDTDTVEPEPFKKVEVLKPPKKSNRKVHFFNTHLINSCYEQTSYFKGQAEEVLFFVEKYRVVPGQPLQSLLVNSKLCTQVGKVEIGDIWISLHSLFYDESVEEEQMAKLATNTSDVLKSVTSQAQEKIESMIKIMAFYKDNPDRFITDLHNQRIMLVETEPGKDPDIKFLENYEKVILQEAPGAAQVKEWSEEIDIRQKSKTALEIIGELIDNGEFIHGYQMYVCLSSLLEGVDPKTVKLWTGTYIDMLTSMGFYNKANYLVKHSKLEIFEGLQKKLQPMHSKCVYCKAEIESLQEGTCPKCSSKRKCGICQKVVKGLNLWCQICGHGGHFPEMKSWFERPEASCPSGCGHVCFKFY
jgi:hypothetical protein